MDGVTRTNEYQQDRFTRRILNHFGGNLSGRRIGMWGMSFKPGTDDLRNAPALRVAEALLAAGAAISAFDPVSGPGVKARFGDRIEIAKRMYDVAEGADALVICTEWREFRNPDFQRLAGTMKQKKIFDGRNLFDPRALAEHGFNYFSVGRPDY
jgi:UDPglucose 6-dehydrogenase